VKAEESTGHSGGQGGGAQQANGLFPLAAPMTAPNRMAIIKKLFCQSFILGLFFPQTRVAVTVTGALYRARKHRAARNRLFVLRGGRGAQRISLFIRSQFRAGFSAGQDTKCSVPHFVVRKIAGTSRFADPVSRPRQRVLPFLCLGLQSLRFSG
jgi:hypothetical protein